MRKIINKILKIILLNGILLFPFPTVMSVENHYHTNNKIVIGLTNQTEPKFETIYNLKDNIWGSIYNAVEGQCDSNPLQTSNGSIIDPKNASNHRWIAISPDMYKRYGGKLKPFDTIWIESPDVKINGWWVINDTKNSRDDLKHSIDFLQSEEDTKIFIKNNKTFSGKFKNIKICKFNNVSYKEYGKNIDDLNRIRYILDSLKKNHI